MYKIIAGSCNSRHSQNFRMFRPNGFHCHVMLVVKSPSLFKIDGQEFTVGTNHVFLIRPNTPYEYRSISGDYVNDWLHFECEYEALSPEFQKLYHQPIPLLNVMHFSSYMQQLVWERHYGDDDFRQENMEMLMQIMLHNLVQAFRQKDSALPYTPYASRLQNLRLNMQAQPYRNFSPKELADTVGVSPSYFQHLYKDFFGQPFKTDLINMRMDYARELLVGTTLKMEEVARMCGYNNEIHFYRQFHQKTGMTPKEFQKKQRRLKENI